MATSYLEEYRLKFGFLATDSNTPADTHKSSKSSIDTLLSRYLTPEKNDRSSTVNESQVLNTEGLNTDNHGTNVHDLEASLTHTNKAVGPCEPPVILRNTKVNQPNDSSDDAIGTGSESEASETVCDVFHDPPGNRKTSALTVNMAIDVNSQVSEIKNQNAQRRHSSPYGSQSKNGEGVMQKSDSFRRVSLASSNSSDDLRREYSSQRLNGRLHRNESTLSSISFESNASSNWSQSDLVEILSDSGHFADITGSSLTLAQFQLDSDSQKDGEGIASWDELCQCCSSQQSSEQSISESKSTIFCSNCKRQTERKEIIQEILDSEVSYGQDLTVIKQQFYISMSSTGLVTKEQLLIIFGNIDDLTAVNAKFIKQIKEHLEDSIKGGDNSYRNTHIGRIICELSTMLLAFENYCLNYPNSLALIEQLRKEKELFNLFLDVSQSENHLLRRMDLKSFLMRPIQRVMKYPLLLKRLHKATPSHHPDRDQIAKAVEKLNNILLHINAQSKLISNMLSGSVTASPGKKRTSFEIALIKLTVEAVGWRHDEIHYVISGKVGFLLSTDSQTSDKLKLLRFNNAHAVLISRGKDTQIGNAHKRMVFPPKTSKVTDAVLLVIKKGPSRLSLMQDPYYFGTCIVSRNSEYHDVFEIQNGTKDSITIRPVSNSETWYSNMRHFCMVLGGRNQRRRNAFPNIVLHG